VARRSGFFAAMAQTSRDIERQRLAQTRAQMQAIRARERAQKAAERAQVADARESRRLYAEAREDETAAQNAELTSLREALEGILAATLSVDDHIDLDSLKQELVIPPFDSGGLGHATPRPDPGAYAVPPLSMVQGLIPGAKGRHAQKTEDQRARFEEADSDWRAAEATRQDRLTAARIEYDRESADLQAKALAQHAEIDAIKAELEQGKPESIRGYFEMVLGGSSWPDGFPQQFVLAYGAENKLLGIDYVLPDFSVVPEDKAFRYVKARDKIESTPETAARRRSLYASVVAQAALRIVHEVFEADRRGQIETVALNCFVDAVDRATGTRQRPCIVSVRTTASAFRAINLEAVEPAACLKGLAAAMSPSPAELAPVRPVLDLKMVDPRFITETDVLSELDQRPNLMELTPSEFESLITNLFTRMGLEARLTQASRDGGVDCVAFDPRPIFGGKVVIQAKRYKNTVGVSAVRDLFGTMQNEGASKGILVTTSGYGAASFQFADGKPIELLSGGNLLYLLAEHTGMEARIVVPDQWRDPVADESSSSAIVDTQSQIGTRAWADREVDAERDSPSTVVGDESIPSQDLGAG